MAQLKQTNTGSGIRLVVQQYVLPFILITSLFFLWGGARAILDVLKPFSYADFLTAVEKLCHRLATQHAATAISAVDTDDSLFLKTDYKIVRIKIGDIRHIEAMSEYLRIYLDSRKSPLVILLSMKKMEERLPKSWFMRVHRSFIINLKRIIKVRKGRIIIEGEKDGDCVEVPIGDNYKDTLMDYINTKFINK